MTVHEPTTFATDLALGALTAVFAVKLGRRAAEVGSRAMHLWGAAFVASAAAAFLGGFYHGFAPSIGAAAGNALWKATLYAGGATGFFLLASAFAVTTRGQARRVSLILGAAKTSAYLVCVTHDPDFRWLVYDYASAMLGVAVLQLVRLRRGPAPGARWILTGIAASVMAALMQRSGLALHEHFNHNDLYHVVQMGATSLLYLGGRNIAPVNPASVS